MVCHHAENSNIVEGPFGFSARRDDDDDGRILLHHELESMPCVTAKMGQELGDGELSFDRSDGLRVNGVCVLTWDEMQKAIQEAPQE